MTLTTILAFTLAMFLFSATPGPGLFATTARVLTSGFGAALGMMIGIRLSDLIFLSLAIAGMATMTEALGELFIVVKLACGSYLIWLGYRMWRQPPPIPSAQGKSVGGGLARNIFDGLVVGLSNPKSILFYAALLPSFVDLTAINTFDIAVLTAIVLITPSIVDTAYVVMATRARRLFHGQGAARIMRRIGGAALAGVGVTVALDR